MKVIKRVFVAIVLFLLGALLLYNVYNFISIKILKKDLAPIQGYAVLEVVSGSMEPNIHIGDMIVINTKNKEYRVNDIITFYDVNGAFVTHRIIYIDKDGILTKGDNNNAEDEKITKDKVVGKYVFKITGAGKIMAAFKTPFVMVMVMVIGVMVCILLSTDKDGKPILTEQEKKATNKARRKTKKRKTLKDFFSKRKTSVKQDTHISSEKTKRYNRYYPKNRRNTDRLYYKRRYYSNQYNKANKERENSLQNNHHYRKKSYSKQTYNKNRYANKGRYSNNFERKNAYRYKNNYSNTYGQTKSYEKHKKYNSYRKPTHKNKSIRTSNYRNTNTFNKSKGKRKDR